MKEERDEAMHQIQELQETLGRMEQELQKRYMQMGKSLLEFVEQEQKAINELVDAIVEIRKHLCDEERRNHHDQ